MAPQASGLSITNLPLEPPKAPAVLGPLRVSPATSPTSSHHSLSPLPLKNGPVATSSTVCGNSSIPSAVPAVPQTLDIQGLPDLPLPRQSLPPIQGLFLSVILAAR